MNLHPFFRERSELILKPDGTLIASGDLTSLPV
jgi:hypothetical protein